MPNFKGNTEEAVIILSDDDKKQEVKKENDDDLVDCQDTKRVFRKRIPAISSDDEYGSKGSPLPKPKDAKTARNVKIEERNAAKTRYNFGKDSDDDVELLSSEDETGKASRRSVRFRRMMSKSELAQETVNAEAAEKERCQRLEEKQKEFNGIEFCDEDGNDIILALTGQKPFLKALTLDSDKKSHPPSPVSVHPLLVKVLKPHQAQGIQFMYDCVFESLSRLEHEGGGILGHCMGLVIIVVPKNVIKNWQREFDKWLTPNGLDEFEIIGVEDAKLMNDRLSIIRKWYHSKKTEILIIGPDLVICDEGHKLKNEDTTLSHVMNKIATRRRLCLSGTPIQNNLDEYFTMVSFVKPGLLGTKKEFANRFANIIKRGQTKDAGIYEVRCMKKRCHVLYERLKNVLQRKDYRALVESILPKQEFVIMVSLTDCQKKLYQAFLKIIGHDRVSRGRNIMPNYHIFSRIWSHPYLLILHEEEVQRKLWLKDDDDFIVSESELSFLSDSGDDVENGYSSDEIQSKKKKKKSKKNRDDPETSYEAPVDLEGWYIHLGLISKENEDDFFLSNKFVLLEQIIKKCEEIGDKILVFSHSLESLRYIQHMLHYLASNHYWFTHGHKALMDPNEEWGWTMGEDYMVIDGSVSTSSREFIQDSFNAPDNLRARLLLISTKAGSLGTNLVGANRVVIFDASWNPSDDTQALFRVYRYGQSKPVYTYRLVAQGTMEQRIYNRQVTKESTAKRVTEEAQIQRHFDGHDLDELYKFDPKDIPQENTSSQGSRKSGQAPRLALPKDRLFADIILSHGYAIESYLTHDTLFDEVEDEKLTAEERIEAWDEYNREKNGANARPEIQPAANQQKANARPEIQPAAKSSANTRQIKDKAKYATMSNLDREAYKYAYNLPDSPVDLFDLDDEEDVDVDVFSRTKRPNILQSISNNTKTRTDYVPAVIDIENEQSFLSDGTIDLNDENSDVKVVTIDPEVIDLCD
ncbi:transcriptional regulator ATRX like protein [Ditylenchus destructor]|nr:transcriptional regulator ATRX like protein [Ditylenchus destructor]